MRLRARTLVLCLGGATGAVLVAGQLLSACVFDFGDCTNLLTCDGGTPSSTSSSSSSSSGTGGADGGHPCTSAAECAGPGPNGGLLDGGVCLAFATCTKGTCSIAYIPGEATDQPYGTCTKRVCDAMGNVTAVPDDTNIWDAGNPCIIAGCGDGGPTYTVPAGGTCDAGSANSTLGTCVVGGLGGPLAACVQCTLGMATEDCVPTLSNCSLAAAGVEASVQGYCVPAHCTDGIKDNGETDVDCGGGACAPCADNKGCVALSDCQSGVCTGSPGSCIAGNCTDHVKNSGETGVDCGGPCAAKCPMGYGCIIPADCQSHVCFGGICQPSSCTDGLENGSETGVDCGDDAGACPPCPLE